MFVQYQYVYIFNSTEAPRHISTSQYTGSIQYVVKILVIYGFIVYLIYLFVESLWYFVICVSAINLQYPIGIKKYFSFSYLSMRCIKWYDKCMQNFKKNKKLPMSNVIPCILLLCITSDKTLHSQKTLKTHLVHFYLELIEKQ